MERNLYVSFHCELVLMVITRRMDVITNKHYISLFFLITSLFFTQRISHATDTINSSQTFRDNGTTLISSGGSFELGFYNPENSKNRYVGIWYKKTTPRTVVWVTNKENPLIETSGMLTIVEPGRLVLLNGTNGVIWSSNTSRKVQNPVAQLLNSGNLVVKDANDDNPENFLWQSFNYPTDTFLPGMKLGVNFVTGLEVYLTSPRSSSDPASGDFTLRCHPTGYPQNVIEKGAYVRFKSGPWNGVRFSGSPNLNKNNIYKFGVVISNNEVYYYNKLISDSVYTRITLSEGGVGQRWVWNDQIKSWNFYLSFPLDNCDVYKVCGAHGICNTEKAPVCGCLNKFKPKDPQGWGSGDWSNGCVRSTPLNCQKGDAFLTYSGIKLPDTEYSLYDNTMTLEECRVVCLKNCSCIAYSSLDISRGGSGCLLWFGNLVDIREISQGQDIYIRIASSELGSEGKNREILIVTLSLILGVLLLTLSMFLYFRRRKKLDHGLREAGRPTPDYTDDYPDESHNRDLELPQFDLFTISRATNNFSINNKLGEGGFGPVYKGMLEEGQEIAVKCLSRTSLQGVDEFKNEVICIAKLQHRNLVKLLGWCIQGEEKILVYEYMTNKSLDLILFNHSKSMLLDWSRRFNIINGIARGLMYLHQDSRLRVIHRDLKASNILLDSDMNPKISDFGLARTFGGNETGADTSRIVGTYGYMSPEYVIDGLFSVKSDVFSYGVIVLEIVSGKRNRGFASRDHHFNLLGHAWMLYKENRPLELVDSCIVGSCNLPEILQSIHVGLLCVQQNPEDRPSISSVVVMLSSGGALPEAKHPGFFTARDILGTEASASSNTASSTNAMSISLLEPQ